MDLNNYTVEELQAEIERRNKVKIPPKRLENINWNPVVEMTEEYVKNVAAMPDHDPDDIDRLMFEAVMEAIYGPKIWDWFNGGK